MIVVLAAIQIISFVYLYNRKEQVEPENKKETVVINSDFEKIQANSTFSQDLFHRLYGDK